MPRSGLQSCAVRKGKSTEPRLTIDCFAVSAIRSTKQILRSSLNKHVELCGTLWLSHAHGCNQTKTEVRRHGLNDNSNRRDPNPSGKHGLETEQTNKHSSVARLSAQNARRDCSDRQTRVRALPAASSHPLSHTPRQARPRCPDASSSHLLHSCSRSSARP